MPNISQKILNSTVVLVPFTSDYGQRLHASEIARLLNLPQKTVFRKLNYLQKERLLDYQREGKNKYYFLNLKLVSSFSLLQIIESYKEILFLSKKTALTLLLNELSLKHSIILFGSYVKGRAKEGSDVDLVILGRKSEMINSIIKKYPFEVNPHFISLELFKKRLKEEQPLAKEIARDHVLFGEKEKIIRMLIDYFRR